MNIKTKLIISSLILGAVGVSAAAVPQRGVPRGCDPKVMSEAYWKIWNADEQAKIDADIEKNRKTDAVIELPVEEGTEVTVEQLTHEYCFGAHLFNFNQLGKHEWNERHKNAFGPKGIFNSATVAFYWDDYEPTPKACRADGNYEDSERYWNSLPVEESALARYWRRPAPGPVIAFCRQQRIRVHGHILVWGLAKPRWLWDTYAADEEKTLFSSEAWGGTPYYHEEAGYNVARTLTPFLQSWRWRHAWGRLFAKYGERGVAERMPVYVANQKRLFTERVKGVAERFGNTVDSWDVVNESSLDWAKYRKSRTGLPLWDSPQYGIMPGDYPLTALLDAKAALPAKAKLNINDWNIGDDFLAQVEDLTKEGARIDIVGCQMHIFDTNECRRLAEGATDSLWVGTPAAIDERLDIMAKTGRPLHVSEVTISASGTTDRDRQVQAILTRNIYRKWFSHRATMGITWWNSVDGGGVYGEPLVSGLFTRDLQEKPAYKALDELINGEWKTKTNAKATGGRISFRGFRGRYHLKWTKPDGTVDSREVYVR